MFAILKNSIIFAPRQPKDLSIRGDTQAANEGRL